MNRLVFIALMVCLFSSCAKDQKKLNEKYILGDWVLADVKYVSGNTKESPNFGEFYTSGFTFKKDNIVENKSGYFKHVAWGNLKYLGSVSKFDVSADSLRVFSLGDNKWISASIKLSSEELQLQGGNEILIFRHLKAQNTMPLQFDKIILSSSACFGDCPVTNTMINSDGTVLFRGIAFTTQQGLFSGEISKKSFLQLQISFQTRPLFSLKNRYSSNITDAETITTTFVKDGKIIKSISDYHGVAPSWFKRAYVPLQYLSQTIPLKNIRNNDTIRLLNSLIDSKLIKGDSALEFQQSETFLLYDYLRKGTVSKNKFIPRFKLHTYFVINSFSNFDSDGRYFTFSDKGKKVTIDIGFNFYDTNAKIWTWRKKTEYDE